MSRPAPLADFHNLVNRVANQFEELQGIIVNTEARELLVNETLPHQEAVYAELATGKITLDFLERSVMQQLNTARDVAIEWGRDRIEKDTTQESMKRKCSYAFWC
jgi:hypothetical protein